MNERMLLTKKERNESRCAESTCGNKGYGYNRINPYIKEIVCRKHYYEFNYGIIKKY